MADTNYNASTRESGRDLSSMADDAADMASEVGGRVSDAASRAQQKVVEYFRNHDANDMLEDLNSYVKDHPTQALLAAAAFGFVAAALLRRR
ncbi:MAG TPA: hypothetical protein VFV78_12280 [Vicinamibacterales bacterium]|nr:hypothetical protein [Vicinamibacterales bacterium]